MSYLHLPIMHDSFVFRVSARIHPSIFYTHLFQFRVEPIPAVHPGQVASASQVSVRIKHLISISLKSVYPTTENLLGSFYVKKPQTAKALKTSSEEGDLWPKCQLMK